MGGRRGRRTHIVASGLHTPLRPAGCPPWLPARPTRRPSGDGPHLDRPPQGGGPPTPGDRPHERSKPARDLVDDHPPTVRGGAAGHGPHLPLPVPPLASAEPRRGDRRRPRRRLARLARLG